MTHPTWRGRYVILVFDCLLVVGIYFCADLPSALQAEIQGMPHMNASVAASMNMSLCEQCLGLGPAQFNQLYTIMSWTSAAIMLPVGIAIDRMGNRVSALVFTGIATSGSFLFAVAAIPGVRHTDYMFPLMMCGRLLLGAGSGSSRIVRDRVIASWFPDKLAIAFGIAISVMGMGSVLTFLLTPNLPEWIGLTSTLFVGAAICSTCFVSAICLSVLDWYGWRQEPSRAHTFKQRSITRFRTIRKFPAAFWLVVVMLATYYSFQLPFTANAGKYIQETYGYSCTVSSYTNGAIYDVSVVLSPIVGIVLNKLGRRCMAATLGALLTVPIGPLLLYTGMPPLVGIIWMGTTFTVTVVSLWSSIAYVVPAASVGTANGIATCVMDLTVGITSLLLGQILDAFKNIDNTTAPAGYRYMFLFLFGYVAVCGLAGIVFNCCARQKNDLLNKNSLKRQSSIGPVHIPPRSESSEDTSEDSSEQDVYSISKEFSKDIIVENGIIQTNGFGNSAKYYSNYNGTWPREKLPLSDEGKDKTPDDDSGNKHLYLSRANTIAVTPVSGNGKVVIEAQTETPNI